MQSGREEVNLGYQGFMGGVNVHVLGLFIYAIELPIAVHLVLVAR